MTILHDPTPLEQAPPPRGRGNPLPIDLDADWDRVRNAFALETTAALEAVRDMPEAPPFNARALDTTLAGWRWADDELGWVCERPATERRHFDARRDASAAFTRLRLRYGFGLANARAKEAAGCELICREHISEVGE